MRNNQAYFADSGIGAQSFERQRLTIRCGIVDIHEVGYLVSGLKIRRAAVDVWHASVSKD